MLDAEHAAGKSFRPDVALATVPGRTAAVPMASALVTACELWRGVRRGERDAMFLPAPAATSTGFGMTSFEMSPSPSACRLEPDCLIFSCASPCPHPAPAAFRVRSFRTPRRVDHHWHAMSTQLGPTLSIRSSAPSAASRYGAERIEKGQLDGAAGSVTLSMRVSPAY
jgi:hypothetical protein